jgi:protein ImuB
LAREGSSGPARRDESGHVERVLCIWCPAWAVVTACRGDPSLVGAPVAVVERGACGLVVRAASAEARAEGVTVGLRRREAEARCGGLVVLDADVPAEARAFEAVARAMEPITPAIVLERPGVLTFPTRGPARYFGGDDALAARVLDAVTEVGVPSARVGIADGAFAARLAARVAGSGNARVIEPGGSRTFLTPWPVEVLRGSSGANDGLEESLSLLVRLGLPTLGDFAALPASSVLARFGADSARAHRLAQGLDEHPTRPAPPPPDLVETCELDPPATRVDEVAFAAKGLADGLHARLEALGLTCTHVVVEAETEHGERLTRCWRHEGTLTSTALVARMRWQLDGWLQGAPGGPGPRHWSGNEDSSRNEDDPGSGGLVLLRLAPEQVIPATGRQLGFWGGDAAATDRADRVLARLQGMLGHDAVVTPVVIGGRAPSERVQWVPWGEPGPAPVLRTEPACPPSAARVTSQQDVPWPGAVPGPSPARVHSPALPAELLDDDGRPVTVSGRGEASGAPARLRCAAVPAGGGAVVAWSGPWAHDVRWWDRASSRRRVLWQLLIAVGDEGANQEIACLVAVEHGRAGVEAVYD